MAFPLLRRLQKIAHDLAANDRGTLKPGTYCNGIDFSGTVTFNGNAHLAIDGPAIHGPGIDGPSIISVNTKVGLVQ